MKKKVIVILLILFMVILNFNYVFCANDEQKDINQIYAINNNNKLSNAGAEIAGYITYGATIAAVIMLMVKGIKFIISSPEGKAQAQKELIPWAIGVVILFAMSTILNFIVDFAQNNINNINI